MRILLALLLTSACACAAAAAADGYPSVSARELAFPSDYGSHPTFRTEWWYVTGWLNTDGGETLGFQVTFFRTRPNLETANPSSFAPRQILIAHCALSDPKRGRLWQDQRIRRAAPHIAASAVGDTDVYVEGWSLARRAGQYVAAIAAEDFALELAMLPTQAPLLNGERGVSSKGPAPAASYYYSIPHLQVTGTVTRAGAAAAVHGEAWFDHEWSSEYLDAQAAGWDWTGINLDDGSALMAFRIRDPHGATHWAGGTLRSPDGSVAVFRPEQIEFKSRRTWTSARTGIAYPVSWQLLLGGREFDLDPLLDDQENDTRLTTGAIYWEGAVRASAAGHVAGRGYLELTGYGEPLRLR
jgi:predicted secreted hydrolase